MHRVGGCHLHGRGVPRSEPDAVRWYQRAAAKDDPDALNALGCAHEAGSLGLAQDYGRGLHSSTSQLNPTDSDMQTIP